MNKTLLVPCLEQQLSLVKNHCRYNMFLFLDMLNICVGFFMQSAQYGCVLRRLEKLSIYTGCCKSFPVHAEGNNNTATRSSHCKITETQLSGSQLRASFHHSRVQRFSSWVTKKIGTQNSLRSCKLVTLLLLRHPDPDLLILRFFTIRGTSFFFFFCAIPYAETWLKLFHAADPECKPNSRQDKDVEACLLWREGIQLLESNLCVTHTYFHSVIVNTHIRKPKMDTSGSLSNQFTAS